MLFSPRRRSRRLSPRLIATSLALVPLAALAGCGGDDAGDSAPATDAATEAAPAVPGTPPQMDSATMGLVMEVQEIQQRLAPIGAEAMEDPALAAELEALQERIDEAFRAENPELAETMSRFQAEFADAQERGDEEALQRIQFDSQEIQLELQQVQAEILELPEIAAAIEAFEEAQRARMIEIDPEAGELMDRMEVIQQQLGMS